VLDITFRAITPAVRGASPSSIGRYVVVRLLGQGAMGRVLLARDTVLGREVAIKLLRDDLGLPPETRDELFLRMRNEARAAASVSHPNLVTLHDMGESSDEGVYLVFEYVPGRTLRDVIEQDGPLSPPEVARLARELGSALDAAHAAGVLHRDVKPENIMLAPFGAKIADFGIARIPDSTLTRAGGLVGTPAYCAPEALSAGVFSPASDQFSLAATLYEALCGERAFAGDDALTVAARIASETPKPLAQKRGLDPRVDAALERAMAKDPASRFPSCTALTDALVEALGEKAMPPLVHSAAPRARRKSVVLGAITLVGAIAIVVATMLLRADRTSVAMPIAVPAVSAAHSAAAKAQPTRSTLPARTRRPRRAEEPIRDKEASEGDESAGIGTASAFSELPPLPPPFADPYAPKVHASPQSPPIPSTTLVPPWGPSSHEPRNNAEIVAP